MKQFLNRFIIVIFVFKWKIRNRWKRSTLCGIFGTFGLLEGTFEPSSFINVRRPQQQVRNYLFSVQWLIAIFLYRLNNMSTVYSCFIHYCIYNTSRPGYTCTFDQMHVNTQNRLLIVIDICWARTQRRCVMNTF